MSGLNGGEGLVTLQGRFDTGCTTRKTKQMRPSTGRSSLTSLGVFNHPSTCWRDNTAGYKQSRRFLKVQESIRQDELQLQELLDRG